MDEKIKIYKTTIEKILSSNFPFNSIFDDSVRDEDFRIVKTKYIDESDDVFNDDEYDDTVGELGIETDTLWDIQCFTQRIGKSEPEWESILKYPRTASGNSDRINWHKIQAQIKNLKN